MFVAVIVNGLLPATRFALKLIFAPLKVGVNVKLVTDWLFRTIVTWLTVVTFVIDAFTTVDEVVTISGQGAGLVMVTTGGATEGVRL